MCEGFGSRVQVRDQKLKSMITIFGVHASVYIAHLYIFIANASLDTQTMHCIGRKFQLGDLYDSYIEKLITTSSEPKVSEEEVNHADVIFNFVTDDSYQSRLHAMGIQTRLGNSIMAGLVQTKGASRYIDCAPTTTRKVRVALHYKCTSVTKTLPNNIKPYDYVCHTATHLVCSIAYGLECFLVVERGVASHESIEEAKKALVNVLESQDYCNLHYTFYGDFKLPDEVKSLKDVHTFCHNLKQVLNERKLVHVPIEVGLRHLTTLTAQCTIDEVIFDKLVRINELHSTLTQYTVNKQIFNIDAGVHADMSKVVVIITKLHKHYKQTLSLTLPCARKNNNNDQDIVENLTKYEYFAEHLSRWIEHLNKEISVIEQLKIKGKLQYSSCSHDTLYCIHEIPKLKLADTTTDTSCKYILYVEIGVAIEESCLNGFYESLILAETSEEVSKSVWNSLDKGCLDELGKRETDLVQLSKIITEFKKLFLLMKAIATWFLG